MVCVWPLPVPTYNTNKIVNDSKLRYTNKIMNDYFFIRTSEALNISYMPKQFRACAVQAFQPCLFPTLRFHFKLIFGTCISLCSCNLQMFALHEAHPSPADPSSLHLNRSPLIPITHRLPRMTTTHSKHLSRVFIFHYHITSQRACPSSCVPQPTPMQLPHRRASSNCKLEIRP